MILNFLGRKIEEKINREEAESYIDQPKGLPYIIVSRITGYGAIAITLIILLLSLGLFSLNSTIVGSLATLFCICFAGLFSLPWVRKLEKKEFKITSIVFISLCAVCAVLWIMCVWFAISIYIKINIDTLEPAYLTKILKFMKVSIIISLQFLITSIIASYLTRHKNKLVFLQFITYITYIYIDIYLTMLLLCLKIDAAESSVFKISKDIEFVFNGFAIALFVGCLIFSFVLKWIFNKIERKQIQNRIYEIEQEESEKENVNETQEESV